MTKVSAGLVSLEASLLGLQTATYLPCPQHVLPCVYCLVASSQKDTCHTGLGLTPRASFNPNHFFKNPF